MREVAAIHVGGEPVELLPERAVWWPGARTLVVADLHLGKEHAFAAVGIGLPGAVLDETLERLSWCVDETGAERVVIAGDLLHAKAGLTGQLMDRVAIWRHSLGAREVLLVPGNHDRAIGDVAAVWGIRVHTEELRDGPFRFVHEPDGGVGDAFTWAGHLHPAVRLHGGRDSVKLACFRIGERSAVLPAFTLFSGKTTRAGKLAEQAWAIAGDRVLLAPTHAPAGG